MKKVVYSISKLNKFGSTKMTGVGFITDEDLIMLSIDEKQPNPLGEDAIKAALEKIKQEETADDDSTASQQKL